MKKILLLLLAVLLCVVPTACAGDATPPPVQPEPTAEPEQAETAEEAPEAESSAQPTEADTTKILVACFSRTGENYGVGYIEKGNTRIIADMIAEQTGADQFEISTVNPYPEAYSECTEVARQEQESGIHPELSAAVENMADYDMIFLGYPIWWSDMPMAVYTFLESYDFSGKTIVPFCTHEGSGLASTESSIADLCPGARVLAGFELTGSTAQNAQAEAQQAVSGWLAQIEFLDLEP